MMMIGRLTGARLSAKGGFFNQLGEDLLNIIFPCCCCGCSAPLLHPEDRHWCSRCADQVEYVASTCCPICGQGVTGDAGDRDRWCRSCLRCRPPFDRARSLVYYAEPVRTLLQRLKFHADTRVTPGLKRLIDEGSNCCEAKDYDLIVPVPLFPARLKKRGLNQALVLSRLFFADACEKIDPSVLIKAKNTPAQSGLSGPERRKNLRGSIEAAPGADLEKCRICLVDDIFTTGATVEECSVILKKKGAAAVDVVTFARA